MEWNERLFLLINGGLASPALDPAFVVLSWFGGGLVALLVAAVLWRIDRARLLRLHLPVLVAGALALVLAAHAANALLDGERPIERYAQARIGGESPVRDPAGETERDRSFPSRHAALAFFLLGYLTLAERRQAVWAIPLAAGVGLSRVYLGAQLPSGVAVGAALGSAIAAAAWRVSALMPSRADPR